MSIPQCPPVPPSCPSSNSPAMPTPSHQLEPHPVRSQEGRALTLCAPSHSEFHMTDTYPLALSCPALPCPSPTMGLDIPVCSPPVQVRLEQGRWSPSLPPDVYTRVVHTHGPPSPVCSHTLHQPRWHSQTSHAGRGSHLTPSPVPFTNICRPTQHWQPLHSEHKH